MKTFSISLSFLKGENIFEKLEKKTLKKVTFEKVSNEVTK